MAERIPLYYTFGNHMHWVDMQWLWGYHVLPGSVRDMIKFCRETGAKGCVNFDGIGYEKMASEAPEALAELRQAVQEGWIEPVGCSYGQPYGLFHGGESNIRQRVYGVRTVMRLLGVRPRTFWEEEFDFFPQLPQMLRGVGFTGASLYFQWTWHTPEVPFETEPVVWWEGLDGSRLLCATRNRLNLHQWPEDFQILLNELAEVGPAETLRRGSDKPGESDKSKKSEPLILQWLELMPSPDWMCRSELMVPKLKELLADDRFAVKFATLGEYLSVSNPTESLPVRRYTMDDVWHGMTLGKNGDLMRQESARVESLLVETEALHAILGVFGRPYSNWDVYPVWELEEAWRELLSAQHHDNDECEGLCGHVGKVSYRRAYSLARHQWFAARQMFKARVGPADTESLLLNLNAWPVDAKSDNPLPSRVEKAPVPAFGFRLSPKVTLLSTLAAGSTNFEWDKDRLGMQATAGRLFVHPIAAVYGSKRPEWNYQGPPEPEGSSESVQPGSSRRLATFKKWWNLRAGPQQGAMTTRTGPGKNIGWETVMDRPDGGINASQRMRFEFAAPLQVWSDHPYGVSEVKTGQRGRKKYPSGDWMTSPQWFEEITNAFTSTSFVRVKAGEEEWLIAHRGCRQWFLDDTGIECVVNAYDPWDEEHFISEVRAGWGVTRCEGFSFADCYRYSRLGKGIVDAASYPDLKLRIGDIDLTDFSFAQVTPSNVLATALYREAEDYSGRDLENYAGRGMAYPYVLRLVEYDGLESDVELTIAGPVAKALKTNLLGEIEEELMAERGDDTKLTPTPDGLQPFGIEAALIKFKVRPFEIATLYLDIVPGRKQFRDLDAKREVWATVHREP